MKIIEMYFELLVVILKFTKICFIACNPLNPDLDLTWKQAWKKAKVKENVQS